jgi:predicted phage tail protein
MSKIIRGAGGGGKGGGGKSRTPVEAPDSLRSKQYARVMDLVSEGEIGGLVSGLQSVYLDDTPVQNPDGSYNFNGITTDWRHGTQAQSYIAGFPAIENEVGVNTEITNASAVVRSITNQNMDAVRVTLSVPSLSNRDATNGDLNGASVEYSIEYNNNNTGWQPATFRFINQNLTVCIQNTFKLLQKMC